MDPSKVAFPSLFTSCRSTLAVRLQHSNAVCYNKKVAVLFVGRTFAIIWGCTFQIGLKSVTLPPAAAIVLSWFRNNSAAHMNISCPHTIEILFRKIDVQNIQGGRKATRNETMSNLHSVSLFATNRLSYWGAAGQRICTINEGIY